MKSNFIPLVFVALLFTQCKSATKDDLQIEQSAGLVQITGEIHNRDVYPNTKEIRIKIPNVSGDDNVLSVAPIQEDNHFYFAFDLTQPQEVVMETYIDFLYLRPGDSIHIELDFQDLSSIKFSGGDVVEINNDFYNYFDKTYYRPSTYHISTDCETNCSIEEIRRQLDEVKRINFERRDEFLQNNSVREEVIFLTEAMIEIDYYRELVSTMFMRKERLKKDFIDPEKMMDEINNKIPQYYGTGLYSKSHFSFISSEYQKAAFMKKKPTLEDNYDWVKDIAYNDTIKNMIWATQASKALSYKNIESFETMCSKIDTGYTYLLDRLTLEYQRTWTSMSNPEAVSSSITGKPNDINLGKIGLGSNNLIAQTIASHKGKVTYIDIGTLWCNPCFTVLDEIKTLKAEYEGKDVDFSLICLNGKEEEWNKVLLDKGMTEIPNHCTSNEETQFLRSTFGMFSIPFGILVNKEGVIVDYGAHVRPEMGLQSKIDHLLENEKLISHSK